MTADYLRRLAGAAMAPLGDLHAGLNTPPPAPSGRPQEEPVLPVTAEPASEDASSTPPTPVRPDTGPPEPTPGVASGEHAGTVPPQPPASATTPLPDATRSTATEATPPPDASVARAPERPAAEPPVPAVRPLVTAVPASPETGPPDASVPRGTGPLATSAAPTATDHTVAPLRHAGIRAVQDLGVRQTGDQAHRRPGTARPEAVDPRLREHLDGLGQRLLAAHPPTATAPPARPPAAVVGTTPAAPEAATASPVAQEVRPPSAFPAPAPDSRPVVARPEPALTIDHLEVRVVVEPPPRQQTAPVPRQPARPRPAWTDTARRYLRNW